MKSNFKTRLLMFSVTILSMQSITAATQHHVQETSSDAYLMHNDECILLHKEVNDLVCDIISNPTSQETLSYVRLFEDTLTSTGLTRRNKRILRCWVQQIKEAAQASATLTEKSVHILDHVLRIIDACPSNHIKPTHGC